MSGVLNEVLGRLLARARFSVRLGLHRVERALEALQRPETRFAAIHLAGTNGKGSTAAMVAACLRRAGYRTGLFTSPHLHRFSERITVSGVEIDAADLARHLRQALAVDEALTFFEVATVAAFCYFAEQGVDVAVIETGLGGRLDATNVLEPLVCAITPIGLDHTQVLGRDLASVAAEKAGIIKPATPVVCARQAAAALAPVSGRCRATAAPLRLAGRDFDWSIAADGQLVFSSWRSHLEHFWIGLRGKHQQDNAALALATLDALADRGMPTDRAARRGGLAQVRWPGRLEWVGRFLLDSAHNPPAARALTVVLAVRRDWTLVYGASQDKQACETLALLRPYARRVIVTRFEGPRAMSSDRLLGCCPEAESAGGLADALMLARTSDGPVVVTGSVMLVGEARRILLGERGDVTTVTDPAASRVPAPTSA